MGHSAEWVLRRVTVLGGEGNSPEIVLPTSAWRGRRKDVAGKGEFMKLSRLHCPSRRLPHPDHRRCVARPRGWGRGGRGQGLQGRRREGRCRRLMVGCVVVAPLRRNTRQITRVVVGVGHNALHTKARHSSLTPQPFAHHIRAFSGDGKVLGRYLGLALASLPPPGTAGQGRVRPGRKDEKIMGGEGTGAGGKSYEEKRVGGRWGEGGRKEGGWRAGCAGPTGNTAD